MGSKWEEFRLDEITQCIVDCPHSTPEWTANGIIVLRNQNIKNGNLNLEAPSYTNEDGYLSRIKRATPVKGDIVFTREAPMGEVCQVPENIQCCLGQRMVLIRPDEKKVLSDFLLYAFLSPNIKHQVGWNEGTGTTVSNVRIPNIKALKFRLPSLPEQKKISSILKTLDDKIALNQEMNKTLEAMAQTLFKSWFVDFDPVKAKMRGEVPQGMSAEVAKLFPSKLVESELGLIPAGWEWGTFADIAINLRKNVPVEKITNDDSYIALEHFNRKSIFITQQGLSETITSNKTRFFKGNLLFGKLRPYFHKVCIAPNDGICSTDILVFKEKEPGFYSYMLLTAFSDTFVENASQCSTGTKMPRANVKDLLNFSIIIPPKRILEYFENYIDIFWTKGLENCVENNNIAKTRDILIPKIING